MKLIRGLTDPILSGAEKAVGENWLDSFVAPALDGYSKVILSICPADECTISLVMRPAGNEDEDAEEEIDLGVFPAETMTVVPEFLMHSNFEYNLRITDGVDSEIIYLGFAYTKTN